MKKSQTKSEVSDVMRKRAEKLLPEKPDHMPQIPSNDIKKLIHELEVHQLQLEMQNDELRRAQVELEEARRKYLDLYEFAPIGYCTLDESASILEVNLTGADLLGFERRYLMRRPFHSLVAPQDQHRFDSHLKFVLKTGSKQACELGLVKKDGTQFFARIESMAVQESGERFSRCRTAIVDVTDRKQTELALQLSEEHYRNLYEKAPNAYFSVSATDGSILRCNRAAVRLLGYDKRAYTRMRIIDLYADTPEGKSKAKEVFSRFKAGESIQDTELQMTHKDGHPIWVSVSIEPVRDASGNIIESRSMVIDITERKRIWEALEASEKEYRDLVDNALVGVYKSNLQGDILYVNRALAKILEFESPEEMMGEGVLAKYKNPEDGALFIDRLKESGNVVGLYLQLLTKTGRTKDTLLSAVLEGEIISGMLMDITERKRADRALQESEDQYRRIVDTAQEGIWMVDGEAKVNYVNQQLADMLGYSIDEIQGRYLFDFMDDLSPIGVGENFEGYTDRVKEQHDFRFRRKDGSELWAMVSSSPVYDDKGQFMGALGMITDVSRRKRAELALKKSSERIKLFAYSISHDLRSPAIGIYGLAKRLHKKYREVLDEKAKGYCDQILEGARQIAELAGDINVYVSTKEKPLRPEDVGLDEVLQMVRDEFSAQLDLRQIKWSQPESSPEIRGDRLSILRALRNLVDNALKYGGDDLSEIKIGYQRSDAFHILSVSDDGAGMLGEDGQEIFGPFQRRETSAGVQGTGLGLAIVSEVAQQHCGKAWFESRGGKGTTFYIALSIDL